MDLSPAARGARGAAYLDHVRPGWHDMIDLDRLDMQAGIMDPDDPDDGGCVLCHIDAFVRKGDFGQFERGLDLIGLSYGANHGFSTLGSYEELNDIWRQLILQRRNTE